MLLAKDLTDIQPHTEMLVICFPHRFVKRLCGILQILFDITPPPKDRKEADGGKNE